MHYNYSVRVSNGDQGTLGPLNRRNDEQWWDIKSSQPDNECYDGEFRMGSTADEI